MPTKERTHTHQLPVLAKWAKSAQSVPDTTRTEFFWILEMAFPEGLNTDNRGRHSGWVVLEAQPRWTRLKGSTRIKYLTSFRTVVRAWHAARSLEFADPWVSLGLLDPFEHPISQIKPEHSEPRAMSAQESGDLLHTLSAEYLYSPLQGDKGRPVGAQLAEDIGAHIGGKTLALLGSNRNLWHQGTGRWRVEPGEPWTPETVLDSQAAGNGLAFLLTWWLGLRFSVEVLSLKVSDFREIPSSTGPRLCLAVTCAKSKKHEAARIRLVPLPAWLIDFMEPWRHHSRDGGEKLIGEAWSPRRYQDAWRAQRDKMTGGGLERLVPYSARHTAISRMLGQGIPAPVVAKMVGHRDPKRIMSYLDPTVTAWEYFD